MLKEVGASGQISLGKKFAGQLFEMEHQPDGSILMRPVKIVPATVTVEEPAAAYRKASQRQGASEWAERHVAEIEQYNAWASQREPYSQRVRRWRERGGA